MCVCLCARTPATPFLPCHCFRTEIEAAVGVHRTNPSLDPTEAFQETELAEQPADAPVLQVVGSSMPKNVETDMRVSSSNSVFVNPVASVAKPLAPTAPAASAGGGDDCEASLAVSSQLVSYGVEIKLSLFGIIQLIVPCRVFMRYQAKRIC